MTDTTPTPPEGPHADPLAELTTVVDQHVKTGSPRNLVPAVRKALAALSDSVPREKFDRAWASWERTDARADRAERERDEARAVIGRMRALVVEALAGADDSGIGWDAEMSASTLLEVLAQAPADALARVKAEAGAQALDDAASSADTIHKGMHVGTITDRIEQWLRNCAAALREEAGSVPDHAVDNASRPDDPNDQAGPERVACPHGDCVLGLDHDGRCTSGH